MAEAFVWSEWQWLQYQAKYRMLDWWLCNDNAEAGGGGLLQIVTNTILPPTLVFTTWKTQMMEIWPQVPAIYCQTVKIRTSKAWNLRAFNNCLTAQSSIDSNYAVKVLQPYFVGQEYLHSQKNVNHNLLTYNYKLQLRIQHELCRWSVH